MPEKTAMQYGQLANHRHGKFIILWKICSRASFAEQASSFPYGYRKKFP
jgi:hypothetical protein